MTWWYAQEDTQGIQYDVNMFNHIMKNLALADEVTRDTMKYALTFLKGKQIVSKQAQNWS